MAGKELHSLRALADAQETHPDLAGLLHLLHALQVVQQRARAEIAAPGCALDAQAARERLASGRRQLEFADLGVEPSGFARLVEDLLDVLAAHDPQWADQRSALGPLEPETLVALARALYDAVGRGDMAEADSSSLLDTAVELALVPFAERAAESVLPLLDLATWARPTCPLCGASPDLALLQEGAGARQLVCARCSSPWPYPRLKCPHCENVDQTQLLYYPSDDGRYRLYVCERCRHYLKTVDLREAGSDLDLSVARVVTANMDVAAQERGYLP